MRNESPDYILPNRICHRIKFLQAVNCLAVIESDHPVCAKTLSLRLLRSAHAGNDMRSVLLSNVDSGPAHPTQRDHSSTHE
jgi:hypothetical protein